MKKITIVLFILIFTLIFLSGCRNAQYSILTPAAVQTASNITELRWSPDDSEIAVLSNNNIYIIRPDGYLVKFVGNASSEAFEGYGWVYEINAWNFIDLSKLRQSKYNIGVENKESFNNVKSDTTPMSEELVSYIYDNYDIHDITELIQVSKNNIFCIIRYQGNYQIIKIDFADKSYEKIFESPEILYGLTSYNEKIFFTGINSINQKNRFNIYRIDNNNVERVLLKHS